MSCHTYSDVTTIAIIYLTTLLHNMFLIIDISLPLFFCILTLVKRIQRKGWSEVTYRKFRQTFLCINILEKYIYPIAWCMPSCFQTSNSQKSYTTKNKSFLLLLHLIEIANNVNLQNRPCHINFLRRKLSWVWDSCIRN